MSNSITLDQQRVYPTLTVHDQHQLVKCLHDRMAKIFSMQRANPNVSPELLAAWQNEYQHCKDILTTMTKADQTARRKYNTPVV